MGTNAVTLSNTKNETSRSVNHALQLREQSARKADEERLNWKKRNWIKKAPNFANTPQVKKRGPTNVANEGGHCKVRIKCGAKVFDFGRRLKDGGAHIQR